MSLNAEGDGDLPQSGDKASHEEGVNKNQIELAFKPKSGEMISGRFSPVAFTEFGERRVIWTNQPSLAARLLEHGPAALDSVEPTDIVFVQPSGNATEATMTRVILGDDRTITLVAGVNGEMELSDDQQLPSTDDEPLVEHHLAGNAPRRLSDYTLGYAIYDTQPPYGAIPSLREAYRLLGMRSNKDTSPRTLSFPTPAKFEELLAELQATPDSDIYCPNIALLPAAHISAAVYLNTFADGRYPVAANEFGYYIHDIGSDHFQSLLTHGEPLMELLTNYSRTVLATDKVAFSEQKDAGEGRPAGEYEGAEKLGAATHIVDAITSSLAGVSFAQLSSIAFENNESLQYTFNDIVAALRETGQLEQTTIAQSILSRFPEKTVEDITGKDAMIELFYLTRQRFDLPEPNAPAPPAGFSVGGIG